MGFVKLEVFTNVIFQNTASWIEMLTQSLDGFLIKLRWNKTVFESEQNSHELLTSLTVPKSHSPKPETSPLPESDQMASPYPEEAEHHLLLF